ncbi:MAG: hypothetical protein BYD32DRAFT_463651 [Podila humilis]|nr:MAG: hypothetical protein BYD32DRAFT_463651 [Podila humilis]
MDHRRRGIGGDGSDRITGRELPKPATIPAPVTPVGEVMDVAAFAKAKRTAYLPVGVLEVTILSMRQQSVQIWVTVLKFSAFSGASGPYSWLALGNASALNGEVLGGLGTGNGGNSGGNDSGGELHGDGVGSGIETTDSFIRFFEFFTVISQKHASAKNELLLNLYQSKFVACRDTAKNLLKTQPDNDAMYLILAATMHKQK